MWGPQPLDTTPGARDRTRSLYKGTGGTARERLASRLVKPEPRLDEDMLIFSIIYTFKGTEKLRSSIGGGVRHRIRELLKTWRLHHVAGRFFASVGSLGRRGLSAAELAGQVAAEGPTAEVPDTVDHDMLEARLRVAALHEPLEPRPPALQLCLDR